VLETPPIWWGFFLPTSKSYKHPVEIAVRLGIFSACTWDLLKTNK